jgi:hypothetical protein
LFSWLKNKIAGNSEIDNCIYYISYELDQPEKILALKKIAGLILIGLTRMQLEGMSYVDFSNICKDMKNEAMFRNKLKDCRHIDFSTTYIVYIFFQNFGFMDTENGKNTFAKITELLLKYKPYDDTNILSKIDERMNLFT